MTGNLLTIRPIRRADLAVMDSLRLRENWNQTAKDLERFLDYGPDGCFVACWESVPVGTVTTMAYGRDLGWIGMMLVDPGYRRRGIATALIKRSLDFLQSKEVATIKLDATPAGEPVYSQLGFRPEWPFERWERPGQPAPKVPVTGQASFQPPAFDKAAFGADRASWLELLAQDSLIIQRGNAFGMLRAGSSAAYLGPVVAEEPTSAAEIIRELAGSITGRLYWDVPGPNLAAARLARELGFQPVRQLLRMWVGEPCPGEAAKQYALADPATG